MIYYLQNGDMPPPSSVCVKKLLLAADLFVAAVVFMITKKNEKFMMNCLFKSCPWRSRRHGCRHCRLVRHFPVGLGLAGCRAVSLACVHRHQRWRSSPEVEMCPRAAAQAARRSRCRKKGLLLGGAADDRPGARKSVRGK